jgi:mRNA interferase RelE/StbE
MKYRVIVHKRAVKYLQSLSVVQKDRIKQSMKKLENGIDSLTDIKQMAGDWKGYYRTRVGGVRIIFWIERELKTIYVDHIGSRGDIYKKK